MDFWKKEFKKKAALFGAAVITAAFTSGFAPAKDFASGQAGMLRSAAYYSDDWVVNFGTVKASIWIRSWLRLRRTVLTILFSVCPGENFSPDFPPALMRSMPGKSWTG